MCLRAPSAISVLSTLSKILKFCPRALSVQSLIFCRPATFFSFMWWALVVLQERPFKSTLSASISHPVGCLLPYYIAFLPPLPCFALHPPLLLLLLQNKTLQYMGGSQQAGRLLLSPLTSNYCSVLLHCTTREMPIRPALMASVSNQSTGEVRV